MRFIALFALIVLSFGFNPALAQDDDKGNLDRRIELAKQWHQYISVRDQVDAAIEQAAQGQPEKDREAFKSAMRSALNYQALEKISVDALVDTYTEAELQAMVDYNSKPEAQSARKKEPEYAKKVYPEIVRMLDKAMMQARTGGAAQ